MPKKLGEASFEAPVVEKKNNEPMEVLKGKIKILGVEIPRNPEPGPQTPPEEKFKDFSQDEFSLDLLQRIAKAAALNQPMLIEGEAAVGKSYTIEYLAHLANREVYRMSLNGQTDTTDLIGKWVPRTETLRKKMEKLLKNPEMCKSAEARELIESRTRIKPVSEKEIAPEKEKPKIGLTREEMESIATHEGIEVPEGEWVWQNGDIPKQMESGAWSVLDEVNTCEPQILVRLNALLEKGGQMILHENGSRIIKRHKNFRLFATVNPPGGRYKGRVPLSAEWISRWNYQNVGDLPKEVRALRLMTAEGVVPSGIKPEKLKFAAPEAVPEERKLVDYYGSEWVKDLFTKYAEFAIKAREMVAKGEIAGDQAQIFDYDQRDDGRFREYLREFREPGNMTKVIREALEYHFYNKLKNTADRKKLKDVAEKLIKVQEPKEILPQGAEDAKKNVTRVKAELAAMGIELK